MIANNEKEYIELKERFLEQKAQFFDLLAEDAEKGNECARKFMGAVIGWELLDKESEELTKKGLDGQFVKFIAFEEMNTFYIKWLICLESRGYPFSESMKLKLASAKELIAKMDRREKNIDKNNLN